MTALISRTTPGQLHLSGQDLETESLEADSFRTQFFRVPGILGTVNKATTGLLETWRSESKLSQTEVQSGSSPGDRSQPWRSESVPVLLLGDNTID